MDITAEVEQFLSSYTPEVRDLAWKTRALVLEVMPDAVEQVDGPSNLIAYGVGMRMGDIVYTLMPHKNWVSLGIFRAVYLLDPHGLLEGTGKHHRHVKIRRVEELDRPGLRELLEAARRAKTSNG